MRGKLESKKREVGEMDGGEKGENVKRSNQEEKAF